MRQGPFRIFIISQNEKYDIIHLYPPEFHHRKGEARFSPPGSGGACAVCMEIDQIIITEEEIKKRVAELGAQITEDSKDKGLFIICLLKGATIFMSDLIRQIKTPLEIDFMSLSSYGASTKTSGVVRMLRDLDREIAGKHILVVEDIVDTGLTLSYLR